MAGGLPLPPCLGTVTVLSVASGWLWLGLLIYTWAPHQRPLWEATGQAGLSVLLPMLCHVSQSSAKVVRVINSSVHSVWGSLALDRK